MKLICLACDTSNSAPNKNTFADVKYNGLLSVTIQRQRQIALLRQDFLAYTFTLLLEFSPSYRPLWHPISFSLICAMIYSCLSLSCGIYLWCIIQTLTKQIMLLSHTKKGTSIFRMYYANTIVYDEYGLHWLQLLYVKVPWY